MTARGQATVDAPLLVVDDTMAGMRSLASHARRRGKSSVVAVTGSTGKTGTKDTLKLALGGQAETHATEGNLNNQWGLPLSLARMPRSARFGVLEMGMNSPGEIAPLSRLAEPDVAIVTNVSAVHIEFFTTEEDIADAKAEIFTGMGADGTAVLNRDNRHFDRLRTHAKSAGVGRIRSFGAHEDADVRLLANTPQATGCRVDAAIDGVAVSYELGAPGAHWALNSLGVLAAVDALGADVAEAARALADVAPAKGRGAQSRIRLAGGSFLLIDESYNASPASTRAALDVLGGCSGRRIAVLGDMLELGARSAALHEALADDVVRNGVELVFLAGPYMASLAAALDPARIAATGESSDALLPEVVDAVRPGDAVMVKGSLGSRMAPIVAALEALDDTGAAPATRHAAR
jgi:UDP-N-acetylmuramoyl-tripeptide--D-alanyl-D-alanine ligase